MFKKYILKIIIFLIFYSNLFAANNPFALKVKYHEPELFKPKIKITLKSDPAEYLSYNYYFEFQKMGKIINEKYKDYDYIIALVSQDNNEYVRSSTSSYILKFIKDKRNLYIWYINIWHTNILGE